jgi:peptidoglycan/LPS O-acetylase OafA/YrhL
VCSAAIVAAPLCIATRLYLAAHGYGSSFIYANTLAHGEQLVYGAVLAELVHCRPNLLRSGSSLVELCAVAAGIMLMAFVYTDHPSGRWAWIWTYSLPAATAAFIVGAFVDGNGVLSRLGLRTRLVSRLGRITYAAYVFHVYCVVAAWKLAAHVPGAPALVGLIRCLIALALTFVVASVSWRLLEARFARLRRSFEPA